MKNTNERYGWITIGLHWSVAMIVIGLFALGYWMVDLTYYDSWYKTGPALHKSIGLFLFTLMLFRLIWRNVQIQPIPLTTLTSFEKKSAHLMHMLLYVLLFLLMLSGYFISTADGRGIEFFALFDVPGFGSFIEDQEDVAGIFHKVTAYLIISMVLIHAAAALKHHFINKDKTLTRMLKS